MGAGASAHPRSSIIDTVNSKMKNKDEVVREIEERVSSSSYNESEYQTAISGAIENDKVLMETYKQVIAMSAINNGTVPDDVIKALYAENLRLNKQNVLVIKSNVSTIMCDASTEYRSNTIVGGGSSGNRSYTIDDIVKYTSPMSTAQDTAEVRKSKLRKSNSLKKQD